jgi:hypothetical protein
VGQQHPGQSIRAQVCLGLTLSERFRVAVT